MKKALISKICSFVLISSACLSITACNNQTKDVHIFSINDFHGAAVGYGEDDGFTVSSSVPGVIRLSNTLAKEIEMSPESMIVSAGDSNSGEVFSSSQRGKSSFPILKEMNVRYSAVGNHEFDWEKTNDQEDNNIGFLTSKKYDEWGRTSQTEGNYFIAANILKNRDDFGNDKGFNDEKRAWSYENNYDYKIWKENIVEWADPYKIVNLDSLKICLIGLTTILTKVDSNRIATKDYAFINYNASVNYAKKLCQEQNPDIFGQIDSFVLLTHVSAGMENEQVTDECADLAKTLTTKIDAIISGHSHKVVSGKAKNKNYGNDIWIGQAGSNGKNYLDVKFNFTPNANNGKKLNNVEMVVKQISIGGGKNKELAKEEIIAIKEEANNKPNGILSKTIKEYENQKENVLNNLKEPIFTSKNSENKFDLTYPGAFCNIGHEYFSSEQIVDKAGLWINKAFIDGCKILSSQEDNPYILETDNDNPSISFLCFDGVKSQLVNSSINKLNLYQMLPFDNYLYKGWISVSQLWSILNYCLSGGWPNNGGNDKNSIFAYGDDNQQYDLIDEMEKNHFTGKKEISFTNPTPTKLYYPCGPLQFYGCKVVIREADQNKQIIDGKHARKYEVDYEKVGNKYGNIISIPKIWIFDPSDKNNNIDDPSTWKKVTINGSRNNDSNEWNYQEDLIQIVVDNFVYSGGNNQNTMFEKFFKFNEQKDKKYEVISYEKCGFLRDIVGLYVENWNKKQANLSFNFNNFACNNDKNDETNKIIIFNKSNT